MKLKEFQQIAQDNNLLDSFDWQCYPNIEQRSFIVIAKINDTYAFTETASPKRLADMVTVKDVRDYLLKLRQDITDMRV